MVKGAFFDIDGTLVSMTTHRAPASTMDALRAMHERGVKLFIASGRSPVEMPAGAVELIEAIPFDAHLMFNGQCCYDDEGVFREVPIDPEDVQALVDLASAGALDVMFMQRTRSFLNRHTDRIRAMEERVGTRYHEGDLASVFDEPTFQMCAYVDPGEESVFMDRCRHVGFTRWCEWFCDIIPAGGGKQAAVEETCRRFGLDPAECVAFGDGGNDVPMFRVVGTSVAMGNGNEEAKSAATFVTGDIDEDGLMAACRRLGLV